MSCCALKQCNPQGPTNGFHSALQVSDRTFTRLQSAAAGRLPQPAQNILWPTLGGLGTGLIALAYPEVLYQGFGNVNAILEARGSDYAPAVLLQIVAAKVVTTSICQRSGLVGGIYAPSIFMGGHSHSPPGCSSAARSAFLHLHSTYTCTCCHPGRLQNCLVMPAAVLKVSGPCAVVNFDTERLLMQVLRWARLLGALPLWCAHLWVWMLLRHRHTPWSVLRACSLLSARFCPTSELLNLKA